MDETALLEWRRRLAAYGGRAERAAGEPDDFGDPEAEYLALREGAALVDRSGFETLDVEGEDAPRFLHGLTTGEIASAPVGSVLYTLVTDDRGRVLADAVVWRREPLGFRLVCERGFARRALAWFDAHRIADRVTLRAEESPGAFFRLAGPSWRGTYVRSGLPPLPEDAEGKEWNRSGVNGEAALGVSGTALILVPFEAAEPVWNALTAAGFRAVGERAAERARIERGIARAGREFDGDVLPMEVGLEGAVSYAKGCYVGQEIIARATYRGQVHRSLVGLTMSGGLAPPRRTLVEATGAAAGWITSAVAWPSGRVVALACVRREKAVAGATVTIVDEGWERRDAVIAAIPF